MMRMLDNAVANDGLAGFHVGVGKLRRKYERIKGPVAFLDETYQAPKDSSQGQKTFYVFIAVVVSTSAMEELRKGMVEIAARNSSSDGRIYLPCRARPNNSRLRDVVVAP